MGKKILFIDDEKDFTEIVSTLLDFHHFSVDTINDPLAVASRLLEIHYDLVVTDLMMPGLSGFELIKQIRLNEKYHKVPIIVVTAKTLSDEERKFLLQNDVSFIGKPFEPQGLVEKITQILA